MATTQERLAVVETEVRTIKETTAETRRDVKLLLAWRDEERGARAQRVADRRKLVALFSALGTAAGAFGAFIMDLVGGL